jgi:hypothetical protein
MTDKAKNNWTEKNPRGALQLTFLILVCVYLLPAALLGTIFFVLLTKLFRIRWIWVLNIGLFAVTLLLFLEEYRAGFVLPLSDFLLQTQAVNVSLIRDLFSDGLSSSLFFMYQTMLWQVLSFSLLVAAVLATFELIPNSAHEKEMRSLQKRKKTESGDIKDSVVSKTLERLDEKCEENYDGTVLGVSKTTNRAVGLPDKFVNQLVLVLGTTGGGKTITLRRFYQRAIV